MDLSPRNPKKQHGTCIAQADPSNLGKHLFISEIEEITEDCKKLDARQRFMILVAKMENNGVYVQLWCGTPDDQSLPVVTLGYVFRAEMSLQKEAMKMALRYGIAPSVLDEHIRKACLG